MTPVHPLDSTQYSKGGCTGGFAGVFTVPGFLSTPFFGDAANAVS